MDDASLMGVLHGVADLRHQLETRTRRQPKRLRVVSERLAADELHGEVRLETDSGVGGAGLENLRDAGMMQARQRVGLALESVQQLRRCDTRLDDFQRDDPVRPLLLDFVHRAHAALAQQLQNTVGTEGDGILACRTP